MINHYLIVSFSLSFCSIIFFFLALENGINNLPESTSIPIIVQNRPSSSRKELQADYNQHVFERPTNHRHDLLRSK